MSAAIDAPAKPLDDIADAQVAYRTIPSADIVEAIVAAWPLLGAQPDDYVSAWLENPERSGGLELRDNDLARTEAQVLPQDWAEGRLFGPTGELRWEHRQQNMIHLVLLVEGTVALSTEYQEPLALTYEGDEAVALWGERQGDSWQEERIPQLHYPDTWTQRYAQLRIRRYSADVTLARSYESLFVRYIGFATINRPA